MPIVVTPSYTVSSSSTTSAGDIIARCSQDARKLLDNNDIAERVVLIDYVNRVHTELLRLSRFRFLLSSVQTFNTVLGKTDYWIGVAGGQGVGQVDTGLNLTDVFTIKRGTVFDRTSYHPVFPTSEAPLGAFFAQNNIPRLWRNDVATPNVINIYPPPDGVYAIEFRYFKKRQKIVDTSNILQTPDDYNDIIIAGVNEYVAIYLKKPDEAGYWHASFESGKRQMIRDMNLFPRGPEFLRPDPNSTTSNTSGGLPTNPIETSIP